jgi:hypothetical protein
MNMWAAEVTWQCAHLVICVILAVFVRNLPFESTYVDLATFFLAGRRGELAGCCFVESVC